MDIKIDHLSKISLYTLDGVQGLPSVDPFSMEILLLLSLNKCNRVKVHKCRFSVSAYKLPYMMVDDTVITNHEQIRQVVRNVTGCKIDLAFNSRQLAQIAAYTEHAKKHIGWSSMLFYWGPESNAVISSHYYCKGIYFPLSLLFARSQRKKIAELMEFLLKEDDVINLMDNMSMELDNYLKDLSTILGNNRYIMGEHPTSLDVYICSELALAKRVNYPDKQLLNLINKHRTLSNYVDHFLNKFCQFKGSTSNSVNDGSQLDDRASPLLLLAAGATVITAMASFAYLHGIIRFK